LAKMRLARHHLQVAHDGWRRDCDARAGQGLVFTVRLPRGAIS